MLLSAISGPVVHGAFLQRPCSQVTLRGSGGVYVVCIERYNIRQLHRKGCHMKG